VLSNYLKPQGEIHILDSPLYIEAELEDANRRSQQYYVSIGFPEMSQQYYHHSISEINKFHSKTLYNPQALMIHLKRRAGQVDSPFPWIMVQKQVK
jgi:hypothetical protein